MKPRIMMVAPPFYRFMNSHNNDSRIGSGYLSAVLIKAGYDVEQYNADFVSTKGYASQKDLFDSSSDFVEDIKKPYHPVYREVFDTIDRIKPDIVGITVMAGTVLQAEIIAKYCQDHDIRTIVGGTMVSLACAEMLKISAFDQLVAGEGEKVIVQAVEHPERKIIVGTNTTNLDTLPFPTRDNFVNGNDEMLHASIATARGCAFRCKYCSNHLLGGEVRFRSAKNVVNEIEYIVNTFKQRNFRIFDDTFTLNQKRVYDFCTEILRRGLKIKFLAETRVDCLDKEMITALKEVGMNRVKLGIESGSEKILKIYKPQYNKDDIRKVVKHLKTEGISVSLNWMFGFPEETDDDLSDSIKFAKELKADYNTISSLAPYYGTDLFDELPDEDKKNWKGMYHTVKKPIMNKKLSDELIQEFLEINDD